MIVDDPWGRKLAARDDLEFHGTVWVLQRFYELGLLTAIALWSAFESLRQQGTRLPWEIVNAFLREIGQEPLVVTA